MKKIIRVFLLVIGVFVIGGCSNKKVATDVSSLNYLDSSSAENIAYNLSLAAKEIKGTKFSGSLTIKDKKYEFSGELIVKDAIENSILHINYKNNNLYIKNGNIYISYYYNNTNVVVKDTIDNFVNEIISILQDKKVKCNKEKIYDILKNKNISNINFASISNKIQETDDGFVIEYKGGKTHLNDKYLPTSFDFSIDNITLNVNFDFSPVSIKMPIGYDLLTLNIKNIKDLLKVNNISELIK